MLKITREFYIPKNAEKREYPDLSAVAYLYHDGDKFGAVCFSGKRQKPDRNYLYRSAEKREKDIQEWLDGLRRQQEYKAKRRAERTGLAEPANSAKILKGYLREFFPGVKFSVKSSIFSGGSSIDIHYTDGPLYEEVDSIARLFQHGWFDGMTDSYNYRPVKVGCAGASYVHVHRELSPEFKAALLPILQQKCVPRCGTIGNRIEDYVIDQVTEAEMIYRGITPEEIDRRTRERIEIITAMGVLAR